MTAALLLVLTLPAPPADVRQERTDTSFAVAERGTLTLENYRGRVVVRGAEDNRVHVRATHSAQTRVNVRHSTGSVRIDEAIRSGGPREVRYEITVPHGWEVRLTGHRTGIVIDGTRAAVRVSTNGGDITVRDVGAASLMSINGEIMLTGARGDVRAEAVNDGIQISDVRGDVEASTVNGSITLGAIDGSRVHGVTVNGRVQFTGVIRPGGDYSFDTHNGDVTLTLAADVGADVTVATHGGNVEADFPVQVRGDVQRSGVLRFTLGNGGARLHAQSFNGAIRLIRADRGRP